MKLATLKSRHRDGQLVVVSRDLARCEAVPQIAANLQFALDHWSEVEQPLLTVYQRVNDGAGQPFDQAACHSPLPRAYQFADGSAYLNHVELVRRARGAKVPESFYTDPLMYQGGSDGFIGPRDPMCAAEAFGIDFEAEVAVITGDIALGASADACGRQIRLVMLMNDVSLRELLRTEITKELGFVQSKPASAFSPVAVTPDELGDAWRGNKLHLPMQVWLNDQPFGRPDAGADMNFDFGQIIAHLARTRNIAAGSIVGGGTVSNKQDKLWGSSIRNGGVGYCCIAEVRMYETIELGKPMTPFMRDGDCVRIEMFDAEQRSIFGRIENRVAAVAP
ncbi:MAG: fumarylacetoacetate hydrolase family protein [Burkholderiales bacterium]|nr:fumarylacetoacetate hydrolase family protein [Burkholderiales bacterium]